MIRCLSEYKAFLSVKDVKHKHAHLVIVLKYLLATVNSKAALGQFQSQCINNAKVAILILIVQILQHLIKCKRRR
jgi:hypothetical protein